MSRKIDPTLAEILRQFGCDPATDIWDCHGTWVAYHRTLEKIAAKAGIVFDAPQIVESDGSAGVVAIYVTGRMGEKSEWSFGECSPKNNKNAYPYSMAEKRAKDRVIIKLVGLHGVYSEDEADDFKPASKPSQEAAPANDAPAEADFDQLTETLTRRIRGAKTGAEIDTIVRDKSFKATLDKLPDAFKTTVKDVTVQRRATPQPDGGVIMTQTVILRGDIQRAYAKKLLDRAPVDAVVSIREATRSTDQNDKMWAMLSDISRAKPEGRRWTPETWKCAFMHALGHQVQFCEGLDDSGPFPLGFRSSRLTVRQMADLITCIQEYGDRHGVDWSDEWTTRGAA